MTRAKRDEFLRHEPSTKPIARKKVTTQRNLKIPPRPGDDADTFGSSAPPMQTFELRESTVVRPQRDRTPKGVNDGRGKRSVADVLMSTPTPEGKAVYAMERIASLEDQIAKLLDLAGPEAREIIFKRRAVARTLKQLWEE